MLVPFHDADGGTVISQFEGYEDLEEFDWEGYAERYDNIARLDRILEAEGDTTNRYKLSKQADALMLFYLLSGVELGQLFERLGYSFDEALMRRTIEYYAPRTSHGSTLSSVVHSWVLARADRRRSWEFFRTALEADVSDVQGGTTPEGIHLGAMAGSVDLLLRGYGGIEPRGDVLRLNPKLPDELGELQFSLSYRGQQLTLTVTAHRVVIVSAAGPAAPISVAVREQLHVLRTGTTLDVALD
jgi:alpha,alpha-trehalase